MGIYAPCTGFKHNITNLRVSGAGFSHANAGSRTVSKLGMSVEEIAAGPHWVVFGADRLLHSLQVLPHRVDAAVHVQQLRSERFVSLDLHILLAAVTKHEI